MRLMKRDILKKALISAGILCASLLLLIAAGIYQVEVFNTLLVVMIMFFVMYLLEILFYRNRMLPAFSLLALSVLFIIDAAAGFICFMIAVALYKPLTEKARK
jgi:hypothetical protein